MTILTPSITTRSSSTRFSRTLPVWPLLRPLMTMTSSPRANLSHLLASSVPIRSYRTSGASETMRMN